MGILAWDIDFAQSNKKAVIDVVSESYPHLEQGAIRDFKNIMSERNYWKDSRWNETKHIYTFETGSTLQFQSYDKLGKTHGPRRDILHLNEALWLPWPTVEQLMGRTRRVVWAEYNPLQEFWMHTEIHGKRDDYEICRLTYLDNEGLPGEEREYIESRKKDPRWFRVYGEGLVGEIEGRIYTGWQMIDEIPHEARLEGYGLDFGYDPDPAAIVAVYYYNGGYILDELLYARQIDNLTIAKMFKNLPQGLVVADSAEPKSIAEISSFGVNIIGAEKGRESVRYGVKTLQSQRISVTKRSTNLIKEYRNYFQSIDRKTNNPIMGEYDGECHALDACFAPSTLVHTTKGKIPIRDLVDKEGYLYSVGGQIKRFFNVRPTRQNAETLKIEFTDGEMLEVTPDHRLLREDGLWIRADCFMPLDRIQSVTYESNNTIYKAAKIQWHKLVSVWKVFCQPWIKEAVTSGGLGISFWGNTNWLSYTSQRQEQGKQPDREFRTETERRAFERTYDSREARMDEKPRGKDKAFNQKVAQVERGAGMAQITRNKDNEETEIFGERMRPLSYEIYNKTLCSIRKILWNELQNESPNKTIKRITRGFAKTTYDLEVEDTHCLIANGVIAHNSRYKLCSLIPIIKRKEVLAQIPKFPSIPQSNPV